MGKVSKLHFFWLENAKGSNCYAAFNALENLRFSASFIIMQFKILSLIKSLRLIYAASKIILPLCAFQQKNTKKNHQYLSAIPIDMTIINMISFIIHQLSNDSIKI